ncbi:cation diffusion facilitator family transporter [Hyphomonas neptunium ATCC 15444]|uniref:Cation diffusion facilitator family transporter n=2 Tax=Hyphomonas TaxID=85 RepID=Q0C4R5_HYPNA|nr:cation diffusion facilitator family transporter [Hyphomonas neptunium ATCC 15444]
MHAHGHSHGHDHSHAGHSHEHHADMTSADSRRRVAIAAALTAGFMLAEIAGGLISGSLALLADAAHMFTDAGSLILAWIGYKLAERPADPHRSYGFARMKILAAFTNGVLLILLGLWIIWEAVHRLLAPVEVMGGLMLLVAAGGLLVNIAAFAVLHGGDREDLNMRGALWHVAGDLLGSVAAILAAGVILWTGWTPADPILSALVAGLVIFAGVRIMRQSGHILLEGAPNELSVSEIVQDLSANVAGVARVSHVHAWSLTESRPLVTLEVTAKPGTNPEILRRDVKARLASAFKVSHATVEVMSQPE